ncbi:flagellar motor switch protein FliG [Algirhabdus cladophorae]|uniref:flagellar motor switch protein FliG n=1 Tax=Algirhabdus cladophorae TaxID=3377108 RepID=UPI003B84A0F0
MNQPLALAQMDMNPVGTADFSAGLPAVSTTVLTQKQKAAVIVQLLLVNGADLDLAEMPDSMQEDLTFQLASLRRVDGATLHQVVEEFVLEFEAGGLTFPNGLPGALDALDGKIAAATAHRMRKNNNLPPPGDPWDRIAGLESEVLAEMLLEESVEVAAVVLSKIKVSKAAELLGHLPGETARRITYAVSQTGAVTPAAVERIGRSIEEQLDAIPVQAFDSGPVERIGAILNSSASDTREEVLTGLDETDKDFSDLVRKAIFTFANIATRLEARDIPKIVKVLDQDVLCTALAAGHQTNNVTSAEFILENMSKRMAEQLREDMAAKPKLKPADADGAMNEVVGVVRQLEADGEIFLRSDDEEEEE